MNGRLMSVSITVESSIFAFSAAFLQALQRHAILAEIDAVALLELRDDPVDDALIEVVAAEVRVAVGRLHFDHALADSRIEMSKVPPPKS
jgi:hypothetical protein